MADIGLEVVDLGENQEADGGDAEGAKYNADVAQQVHEEQRNSKL